MICPDNPLISLIFLVVVALNWDMRVDNDLGDGPRIGFDVVDP
jgi:hypothetical protein